MIGPGTCRYINLTTTPTNIRDLTCLSVAAPLIPLSIPVLVQCPSPLVAANQRCAFSCTLPSLTEQEYINVKVMQGVLGWISWVQAFFFYLMLMMIGISNSVF